jgi:hypothetical protein
MRAGAWITLLSVVFLAGIGLVILGFQAFDQPQGPAIPTTIPSPPTTCAAPPCGNPGPPGPPQPPVYTIDLDRDGRIDMVQTEDQLVAVPKTSKDNGPIVVAIIGGVFLITSTLITGLLSRKKETQQPPVQTANPVLPVAAKPDEEAAAPEHLVEAPPEPHGATSADAVADDTTARAPE